jgi:hypothetical protein
MKPGMKTASKDSRKMWPHELITPQSAVIVGLEVPPK